MSRRFSRKRDVRLPKRLIRIFTEGKKTEPNYFNAIRDELHLSTVEIKVHGDGYHTMSLVDYVIKEQKKERGGKEFPIEWWVVFDKDDHELFNESIEIAKKHEINVAYSNECFELWFILHFQLLSNAIGRENYSEIVTKHIGKKYEKENPDIYDLVKDKESIAIRNAKHLEKMHTEDGITSPLKRDPSTTVYLLVERLRRLKVEE